MANRRFAPRSRKRVTSWHGQNVTLLNLVVGTPQFAAVIPESTLETFPTPTLIRTRGRVMVVSDPSSSASPLAQITMGITVVTAAALAASAIPSPLSDIGSDWLWWDTAFVGEADTGVVGGTVEIDRISVDSKAMRKIGLNEVVVFVVQITSCQGTVVANVCANLRMLLKAP